MSLTGLRKFCSKPTVESANAPQFGPTTTAIDVVKGLNIRMDRKVVLITGGTSGLGVETARALATTDAHVIITGRDMSKGGQVVEDIKRTTHNNKIEMMELDLNSLNSVRDFAARFRQRRLPINILICNAGIMACPYTKTVDGFESQFAVNHLAHFLLVNLLLPELRTGKPSRVVVVSSMANKMGGINFDDINSENNYNKWVAYAQSKSANILFAKQFNKMYAKDGIQAFSLHPGIIMTNLQRHTPPEELKAFGALKEDGSVSDICKSIEQGAATSVYAALAPELNNHGGEYLEDCSISRGVNTGDEHWGMGLHVVDMNNAERLWTISEQLVALH
ncbi:unnamed protein product [Rotaria magnacalcarata]|uniref:Uncharacterized protein n=1 Tax=Rotaria magnacalcarata TaxID=392030 RepID=A0A819YIP0_9BILA|nr:unnamed protein product [Rotaria magnacalcarata]CAF1597342.1 unnamed protein product [Rotaria magnacalcarata]CAF1963665.1 unnamed protein product [Rotaria magnacalcarata]CAF2088566.1 unnamed protein product [Rotaria magnacalcarata]CAF2168642.1 unnamed protein product [Rotaria magnacalcarata]